MKKIKLLTGALLVIGLTACSDDLDVKREVPVTGEEVAFGTSLRNFETPQSRTIYGVPDGEKVDEEYTALTVDWVKGDKVRVYSPQATAGFQSADYVIDEETEGGNAHYFLVKDSHNDTGVRWGDVNTLHHFYAFYPTNINRNNYTPIKGLGKDGIDPMTVEAVIPVAQEKGELVEAGNEDRNIGNITLPAHWKLIRPDMTYAIMAGHGTWDPNDPDQVDKNVTIKFKPIVTVVDVVVNGPEDGKNSLDVYRVTINSKTKPIVGKFTAKFDKNKPGQVSFDVPEEIAENNNMATINCAYDGVPTKLAPGEKLTLKFFLLPRNIDASELSVTVQINDGRVLTKSFSSTTGTTLNQGEIVRVWTPKLTVPASSNWMSSIPDNVLFSQLSLPGSKHSYTGDLYNEAQDGGTIDENGGIMQYYQSVYVSDKTGDPTRVTQFDKGVRAFDLKIRNDGEVWEGILEGYVWDKKNHVYAGQKNVGELQIGSVLTNLKNQMAESDSKDEACVVMLNYVSPPDVSTWLSRLETGLSDWNTANPNILKRINPASTTMGDMRGKIAVIVNVPDQTRGSLNFVNYIYGFSSSVQNIELQDLTLNDGQPVRMQNLYQVNNPDFESPQSAGDYAFRAGAGLVPYYITEQVGLHGQPESYYDLLGRKEEMMNALFDEMRGESYNALVINDLAGFCVTKNASSTGSVDWGTQEYHYIGGWTGSLNTAYDFAKVDMTGNESATYKWNDNPSNPSRNETWFRLTGSRELGQGGNTVAFARLFNPVALNAVYNMVEHGRVPMGIVLMNFAGTDNVKLSNHDYEVYGEQLPSTIMSNNFMFSLKTGTTTTKSSSNTSYSKAGNAWD